MVEGWHNNDYLVLSENEEDAHRMTEAYGMSDYVPGHTVVGLRNWDDFILSDGKSLFTLPTVPIEPKYLEPFTGLIDPKALERDGRFVDKVKWFLQPVVFGGDAEAKENLAWVSHEQHAELVRWWARFYREEFVEGARRGAE